MVAIMLAIFLRSEYAPCRQIHHQLGMVDSFAAFAAAIVSIRVAWIAIIDHPLPLVNSKIGEWVFCPTYSLRHFSATYDDGRINQPQRRFRY